MKPYKGLKEELVKIDFFTLDIKIAPENPLIYDNFGHDNKDDQLLVESIKEHGIREHLVLSEDHYLLSGHRRLSVASFLCMLKVPVRIVKVNYLNLPLSERLELLRSFNFQRDKSPNERIREELLSIDKEEAYDKLKERKSAEECNIPDVNIKMGRVKRRSRITAMQFLNTVKEIIGEEKYLPMTVRRIHYLLLNKQPLKHDKKPNSVYKNDGPSYKALVRLVTQARLSGDIPMWQIEDTTRPIQLGGGYASLEEFVKKETDGFLKDYSRDLMMGQPHHIEILLEKDGIRSIIEAVGREYCIPVTTGRGYSSLSPRHAMSMRYWKSGKKKFLLLVLSDFDPDGEEIAASFARSLRDDFHINNIHPRKVAITAEDVENEDFPSDLEAKPTSSNYKKFVEQYGEKVIELDAGSVEFLQDKLREAIEGVIDIDEYSAQIELEKEDAANVEAYRKTVMKAIGLQ